MLTGPWMCNFFDSTCSLPAGWTQTYQYFLLLILSLTNIVKFLLQCWKSLVIHMLSEALRTVVWSHLLYLPWASSSSTGTLASRLLSSAWASMARRAPVTSSAKSARATSSWRSSRRSRSSAACHRSSSKAYFEMDKNQPSIEYKEVAVMLSPRHSKLASNIEKLLFQCGHYSIIGNIHTWHCYQTLFNHLYR